MSHTYKHFTVRQRDEIAIIDVNQSAGEALFQDEFTPDLLAFIGARAPFKLVVNLSSVSTCTSSLIGGLIAGHQRIQQLRGSMKLCNLSEHIHTVFQRLNLVNTFFEVYETEQEAISGLGLQRYD